MSFLEMSRAAVDAVVACRPMLDRSSVHKLKALDVGIGGMRLLAPQPYPTGTCFSIDFRLPNSPLPLRGEAQVRFCNEAEGGHVLGVAFVDRNTRRDETVRQYLERSHARAAEATLPGRRRWLPWARWAPLSIFK